MIALSVPPAVIKHTHNSDGHWWLLFVGREKLKFGGASRLVTSSFASGQIVLVLLYLGNVMRKVRMRKLPERR